MKKMFLLSVLLVIAVAGCQSTPAPVATVTPLPAGKLVFEKEFKDTADPWCAGGSYDFGDFYCKDNEFHLVAKGGNIATMYDGDFKNFILEAQMHTASNTGTYGVVFRGTHSPATFYIFQIQPDGQYQLIKWSQVQEQNGVLIPWTGSDAIHKGQTANELKVLAQGAQITLYVNSAQLASITDDSFAHGVVGPIATEQGHAAVSSFKVWELP